MGKILVIVNGYPRSGKDSMMDYCMEYIDKVPHLHSSKHSTIDTCKRIAADMGWDGTKTRRNREMLSKLKDFYTEYFDGPLNEIKSIMLGNNLHSGEFAPDVLFVAMREPDEISRTVQWCSGVDGLCCFTVLVKSDRGETEHNAHSDANVLNFKYDYVIENNGTLEELKEQSLVFAKKMMMLVDLVK